ncbi:MAG: hypothetical protein V1726_08010 [Methanobacteriota archaeon]
MPYVIFEVNKDQTIKINTLIKDDLISRQSILTRDAHSLDIKGEATYLKIEGSAKALKHAEELAKEHGFKKLDTKKAKKINEKIEQQEDSAATGMGMIFD